MESTVRRTHLGRALARAQWVFADQFDAAIRARGFEDFRRSDVDVIARLPLETGARISELTARSPITKQAMGQLVRSLERRGYVERRADPDDGRAVRVMLAPRGGELLSAAGEVIEEIEARWEASLGAANLTRLRRALLAAADAMGPPDYL